MTTSWRSFSVVTSSARPMSGNAGIMASMAKALSAISPASSAVISRVPGRFTPSWNAESNMGARLLADPRPGVQQ